MANRDRLIIDLRNRPRVTPRATLARAEPPPAAAPETNEQQPWLESLSTVNLKAGRTAHPEPIATTTFLPPEDAATGHSEERVTEALLEVPPRTERRVLPVFLSWTAAERKEMHRHPYWFFLPSAAALLLVLIGILTRNYFFIAFVVLAFAVAMTYLARKPRMISVALTDAGVRTGSRTHSYSDLKSFWVDERRSPPELSVETTSHMTPFIVIPIADTDPTAIRELLRAHLPERRHEELLIDTIARGLGF